MAMFFRQKWCIFTLNRKKLTQIPHNHVQPQTAPSGPQFGHLDHYIPLVAQVPYHLHSFKQAHAFSRMLSKHPGTTGGRCNQCHQECNQNKKRQYRKNILTHV